MEVKWPESTVPIDDALLKAVQTWVLRFVLSNIATPAKVLNALRRLEVMKEFPLRQEKQARTLALAEARVELRRRSLDLREALLKERREMREIAAAKAAEKTARAEAKVKSPAPAPTKTPSPIAKPASVPAPVVVDVKEAVKQVVTAPLSTTKPFVSEPAFPVKKEAHSMAVTTRAFGAI